MPLYSPEEESGLLLMLTLGEKVLYFRFSHVYLKMDLFLCTINFNV